MDSKEKDELETLYMNEMKRRCFGHGMEDNHIEADQILCDLLNKLGFEKITELFDDIDKWYS